MISFPPRMRLGCMILLMLLIGTLAWGQTATPARVKESRVSFHSIDVYVNQDGSATVEERFFFSFFAGEAAQFVKDFEENTPSLAEWKKDYPFIRPRIGSESKVTNVEFTLNRTAEGDPSLTMSYKYPAGLAQAIRASNEGRSTRWRLSDTALVSFISGGNIFIPASTQVKLHIPAGAIVDTTLLPQGVGAASNVITLSNFQSNSLEVQYTLISPIADPIDFTRIFTDFTRSPLFALVLGLIILGGAYAVLNREKVVGQVEGYIIEHSEFRPSPKQDIDADLETEA